LELEPARDKEVVARGDTGIPRLDLFLELDLDLWFPVIHDTGKIKAGTRERNAGSEE